MKDLILEANRTGYGTDQINHTMTIGELMAFLQDFDEDTKIYISNDNGYTYGGINYNDFREEDSKDEEEE